MFWKLTDGLDIAVVLASLAKSDKELALKYLEYLKVAAERNINHSARNVFVENLLYSRLKGTHVHSSGSSNQQQSHEVSKTIKVLSEKQRHCNEPIKISQFLIEFIEYLMSPVSTFVPSNFISLGEARSSALIALMTVSPSDARALSVSKKLTQVHEDDVNIDSRIIIKQSISGIGKDSRPSVFLSGTPYKMNCVFSNLSNFPQNIDILTAVPKGSVPLAIGSVIFSDKLKINPFSQRSVTFFFYFPSPGDYLTQPVILAKEGSIIATSSSESMKVILPEEYSTFITDTVSSDVTSLSFSDVIQMDFPAILDYLTSAQLSDCDLTLLTDVITNATDLATVLNLLRSRGQFIMCIWELIFNFPDDIDLLSLHLAELLHSSKWSKICKTLGPWMESPIYSYDQLAFNSGSFAKKIDYESLILKEYHPYIESRAHKKGKEIPNALFSKHVKTIMENSLFYERIPDSALVQMAFVQLQLNKPDAARKLIERVENSEFFNNSIQGKYFNMVLNYRLGKDLENPADDLVNHHLFRWRSRFQQISNFCNNSISDYSDKNIAGEDRERARFEQHSKQTETILKLSNEQGKLFLNSSGLSADVSIGFWVINLELLFSLNPFSVSNFNEKVFLTLPQSILSVKPTDNLQIPLPEQLKSSVVGVCASAEGRSSSLLFFPSSLNMVVNGGRIVVKDNNGEAAGKAYIKVFAQNDFGTDFVKDGFTNSYGVFGFDRTGVKKIAVYAVSSVGTVGQNVFDL
ncbi:hypothetical protein GEMRC1_007911 [Eukaryota sp. GEM-RC1]